MHILLTNDDGVAAPGLLALAQSLRSIGHVSVFAPHRNWSASGHVKTLHRPLRVWEAALADESPALTSDGAPSDCVAMALAGLIEGPIDLVVSGINPHANLGHDMTYSSTVMAAMEAAIAGVPGIAVSLDTMQNAKEKIEYAYAAHVTAHVIQQLMVRELPPELLLNVNLPHLAPSEIRGVQITYQGKRIFRNELVRREDPRGQVYYWIGGKRPKDVSKPGTDSWALSNGYISITPLQLDLTAETQLPQLSAWEWTLP